MAGILISFMGSILVNGGEKKTLIYLLYEINFGYLFFIVFKKKP